MKKEEVTEEFRQKMRLISIKRWEKYKQRKLLEKQNEKENKKSHCMIQQETQQVKHLDIPIDRNVFKKMFYSELPVPN